MSFNSKRKVPGRAKRSHESRPKWDQLIDESKNAETVLEEPTLENVKRWEKNKDEIDIRGIDSKKPENSRQKASPPSSTQADKDEKLKNIISRKDEKDDIFSEAEEFGLSKEETEDTLRNLSSRGEIFQPEKDNFELI